MAVSAKVFVFVGLTLVSMSTAFAEDSKPLPAGQRCEGTLCDWYYGSRGTSDSNAQPAASGAPTPVTAPSGGLMNFFGRSNGPKNAQPAEEPSASNSYMSMTGGGLISGAKERCTGTLCDVYYGGSPKPDAGTPSGQQQAAAGGTAAAEPRVPYHHTPHESEIRPKCSSPAADPWRCFR